MFEENPGSLWSDKGQLFWYLRFSQKINKNFNFTTMVPQVEFFLFGRIEDTKKKLTDLQLAQPSQLISFNYGRIACATFSY